MGNQKVSTPLLAATMVDCMLEQMSSRLPPSLSSPSRPYCLAGPAAPDRKSRIVSDKIKKRLSMRYADDTPSAALMAPPAVPSLPTGLNVAAGRRRAPLDQTNTAGWGAPSARLSGIKDEGDEGDYYAGERKGSDGGIVRKDPGTLDMAVLGKDGYDPEACKFPTHESRHQSKVASPDQYAPLPVHRHQDQAGRRDTRGDHRVCERARGKQGGNLHRRQSRRIYAFLCLHH